MSAQLSMKVSAQNYFGVWEGYNDYSFGWVRPLKVVLELYKENDSTIYGASHLYYKANKYEHYNVRGTINLKDQTIKVSEVSELSVKLGFMVSNEAGTYNLKLDCSDTGSDTVCTLNGTWRAKKFILFLPRTINTFFKRTIPKIAPQIPANDTALSKPVTPMVLQRRPDIQSLVEVDNSKTDSINIKIYDNGEIDHDSISLYLDDSILIYKQQISLSPIILNIPISKINSISKLTIDS